MFRRGELQSRSRGSIFALLWRCAWQFEEVLGEHFQVEGGRGELQDGNDGGYWENLLRRGCCIRQCVLGWHGVRDSLHKSGVTAGVALEDPVDDWASDHLRALYLQEPRQVPGRHEGKLLACDLTGAQMSLLEILVPGGFFFNFIRINSSGKLTIDPGGGALRC